MSTAGNYQSDPVNASWVCVLEIIFYIHSNIVGFFLNGNNLLNIGPFFVFVISSLFNSTFLEDHILFPYLERKICSS